MISALISLVISLAVLYIVYLILNWALSFFPLVPAVLLTVLKIVFTIVAFVIVLNFLAALLGSSGYQFSGYRLK